jgi:AcrR family transcriptional regulator
VARAGVLHSVHDRGRLEVGIAVPAQPAVSADKPPSPRSARTRQAVLAATAALLSEGGLATATIDAIRDRSGVSKTTIYKHWPNRLCVAIDAFADQLATEASLPDTGTARGDFAEQVRRISAFYASPIGSTFIQLLANARQEPVAAEWLSERLLASRQHGIQQLWDRAVARGEVRDDRDPDLAMDLLFGPLMWRLMSGRGPLTERDVDRYADAALNGLVHRTP